MEEHATLFAEDSQRSYLRCKNCNLIFVSHNQHISKEEEKKRYDQHNNDPADPEYRMFLNQLIEPFISKLSPGATGLDFGSGPGPTVSVMLEEKGFPTKNYDPFYADDQNLLKQTYDFVTCTETVEHFRNSPKNWAQLVGLVKKNGWLGVMTEFTDEVEEFSKWHYRWDPTHICFYSKQTFQWIAEHFNLEAKFPCRRVVIFRK